MESKGSQWQGRNLNRIQKLGEEVITIKQIVYREKLWDKGTQHLGENPNLGYMLWVDHERWDS